MMCGTVHNVQWREWRKIWGTISTAFKFTMDFGSPLLLSPSFLHYLENSQDLYSCFWYYISSISGLYPSIGIHTVIKLHSCAFKPVTILWKAIICIKSLSLWNDKRSLIQAFATLFFLSVMKFNVKL